MTTGEVERWREKYYDERDRRYTEIGIEREKALKIKEEADKAALGLAREIQTYKDEKANELREQINSERGHYASKDDLTSMADKFDTQLRPILQYMATTTGRSGGLNAGWVILVAAVGLLATIAMVIVMIVK